MEHKISYERDWWLWQMYRQVASLVNNPCEVTEVRLKELVAEYRSVYDREICENSDPHERLMDYR